MMQVVKITDLPDGGAIVEVEMDKQERDDILSWALLKLFRSYADDQLKEAAGIEPD